MARKQRGIKKIEPAVTELNFRPAAVPVAGAGPGASPGEAFYYIDLNQINSLVNRRFYRQGLINAVASIKITTESQVAGFDLPVAVAPRGQVQVAKLPTTWTMANSWMKGMKAWTRMISEATSEAPSIRPRFLDFKIYADPQHHQLGAGLNLLPVSAFVSAGANVATPGEWDYSTVEIPQSTTDASTPGGNSVTRDIVATGGNYGPVGASGNFAVSLIEGYASSRALPNIEDPNMPEDASSAGGNLPENWLTALFNDGTQQDSEVISDLETQNNIAPYPFENDGVNVDTMYPGGANQLEGLQVHDFENITGSTIGSTTYLRGGAFPCGLIKITMRNYSEEYVMQPVIQINLMPGNHRGLLCSPMQEM